MEACRKNEPVKKSAGETPRWSAWAKDLHENSRLLAELLEKSDWEQLQQAIHHRENLLHEVSDKLECLSPDQPNLSRPAEILEVKNALERALEVNHELAALLRTRKRELGSNISEISKGRKLLNLYKTHRQAAPRFFDRFG